MRADMGKVLDERPRHGRWRGDSRPDKGTQRELRKKLLTWDSVPAHESMKRRHGKRTKHFNEHLGPLRRFLDANVGRPWDKVFSELCAAAGRGGTVPRQVPVSLDSYVVTKTVLIDGKPCCAERRRGFDYGEPVGTSHVQHLWYVCPRSGLLRRSKYVRHVRRRDELPKVVRLSGRSACVRRGDRWELVSVARVSAGARAERPDYDTLLRGLIDNPGPEGEWAFTLAHNQYRTVRRFLTRDELRGLPIPVELLRERPPRSSPRG